MTSPGAVSFPVSEQLADAAGELIRLTASADPAARQCLITCRLCRNSLLYLLDTVPATGRSAIIARRLRALPVRHRDHGSPGHPDGTPPRIRDLRQFVPASDLDRP